MFFGLMKNLRALCGPMVVATPEMNSNCARGVGLCSVLQHDAAYVAHREEASVEEEQDAQDGEEDAKAGEADANLCTMWANVLQCY